MAKLPLEGIRVIEICPIWAGPYACMLLADWGAEVIRVEDHHFFPVYTRGLVKKPPEQYVKTQVGYTTHKKPDYDPKTAHNTFGLFNGHARNKLSMTVNLREPRGIDIFKRLVKASDIFIESNAPRVKESLKITWDVIKEWNPGIIMTSLPAFGGTGPYKDYRALGAHMEALSGHTYMRGYLDEDLTTTTTLYHGDEGAGIICAFAVVMALHQRLNTGKGQYIDIAQVETFIPHFGQAIMDYTMNQRITERMGNRDYHGAVQGCYRCKDVTGKWAVGVEFVDSWVNVTISNDKEWEGFCRALGNPDWTKDEKFSNSLSRWKNHDELDKHIEEWTRQHDSYEVMHILQKEGVPAGPVIDEKDAYSDPHLRTRGFFEELTHPVCGTHLYPGLAWKMSKTPNHLRLPPVCLGEHNEYVYKEIIGVSEEEYEDLVREGHIGTEFV